MSAIGPGDMVECVNNRRGLWSGAAIIPLGLGAVYLVDSVVDGPCNCGVRGGLILRGHQSGAPTGGFCIQRFRLIYRPKSSFIESLKQPAPADRVPA